MARNETYIRRIERELRDFRALFRRHRLFSLLLVSGITLYLLLPLFQRRDTSTFIRDQVAGLFQESVHQQPGTGSNRSSSKPARVVKITIEGDLEQVSRLMPGLKTSMESISADGGVRVDGFETMGKRADTAVRPMYPVRP